MQVKPGDVNDVAIRLDLARKRKVSYKVLDHGDSKESKHSIVDLLKSLVALNVVVVMQVKQGAERIEAGRK